VQDSVVQKRVILGKEHDVELRNAVIHALRQLDATLTDKSWAVGGSQEVETLQVSLAGRTVTVEAETFVGLSITGATDLVDLVVALVHQRMQ
jgi:hypothetical protein